MNKAKAMALIIVILMVGSTAGIALFSPANLYTDTGQSATDGQRSLAYVNTEPLTSAEVAAILKAGVVLLQYQYPAGCTDCLTERAAIEAFTHQLNGFVISEILIGDDRTLTMTGPAGDSTDLSDQEFSNDILLERFCELTTLQPKECILLEF